MKKLVAFIISTAVLVSSGAYAIAKIPNLYDQTIGWALSQFGIK